MSKKILIIEDEKYLLDLYRLKLERSGFDVVAAKDGREGLEAARREKPDLILLDLVMPVMDGYEFLRTARQDNALKDTLIYIWSNLGQTAEIKKGLDDGADGYFVKTNLTPGQLLEKIRKILNINL